MIQHVQQWWCVYIILHEKFEDTKAEIKSWISKKDRHHNGKGQTMMYKTLQKKKKKKWFPLSKVQ
jgi:hypothetical protein